VAGPGPDPTFAAGMEGELGLHNTLRHMVVVRYNCHNALFYVGVHLLWELGQGTASALPDIRSCGFDTVPHALNCCLGYTLDHSSASTGHRASVWHQLS
jgi:hypothetical protein